MGYNKLSNNKYKITTELGYDILGKRRRKTEIFYGTLSEVKIRDAELTKQYYKKGNVADLNDITFNQYSDIFLNKYCKNNIGKITIANYKRLLKRIIPKLGRIKLNKITTLILDKLYQDLKIGEKKTLLSYSSMYDYYKLINVMFNQAIKWELINNNPNSKATKPKKEHKGRNFYNMEQATEFLSAIANEHIRDKALLILALESGSRRGEIVALKWSDIDFNNNIVKIDNSLKIINGIVDEQKAKTNSSIRDITLSDETIKTLKEYKSWQDNYIKDIGNKWVGTNRVFTAKDGKHMHPSTCLKILNKITKKYNLPKITFHELRHTSASILMHQGINPKAISERMGHSTTDITMQIYSHVFDTTKNDSAIAFDKIIKNA